MFVRLLALILFTALVQFSLGEVPHLISYQGILKDSTGEAVEDDIYALQFSIYDNETAGNLLWQTEGFVPIQTTDGLFNHVLGSTNPVPDSMAGFDELWLGITVNLNPEMPRVQLTSVPFSLSAQYADTAYISMDKTIDASELTEGTLDTARYSAYEDLISEYKIGEEAGKLAAGDHTHSIVSYPGAMTRYEDTGTVIETVPNYDLVLKSIYIPQNEIGDFFRITLPLKLYCATCENGSVNFDIKANNQLLFHGQYFAGGNSITMIYSYQVNCIKLYNNEWLIYTQSKTSGYYNNDLDQVIQTNLSPENGVTIDIHISGVSGRTVTLGNLIVEYDVD